jgi:hypothetical protein
MNIGDAVRRVGPEGTDPTLWHKIESLVAGAAITRCGRRMEPKNENGELEASAVLPRASTCSRCYP